ncbi:very short patch repair endonuclease [Mucilaginibacter sp. 3215]|uniref:very short patch repair endonuclease n=1 Tax=Mucilaginibacter sp. 3215 TaxID=3373912 RepID=UPI003D1FA6F4
MADTHSIETRSYNMSRIRSVNTKPELKVRKFLFSNGFRYRLNVKEMPGKPDLVLPKYNAVIFVHGCFWHGHDGCRYFVKPKSNQSYWLPKIEKNINRDKANFARLIELGWRVLEVWECDLKKGKIEGTLEKLVRTIKNI